MAAHTAFNQLPFFHSSRKNSVRCGRRHIAKCSDIRIHNEVMRFQICLNPAPAERSLVHGFETAFYANPDLRGVRPPEEPKQAEPAALDLASLVEQLQQSPELAQALASLISAQAGGR